MCCDSLSRSPRASDRARRSDPAKSTRYSTPRVRAPESAATPSTRTITTEWLLLDRSFIAVAPVARFTSPSRITSRTSSADDTRRAVASGTFSPVLDPHAVTSTRASASSAKRSTHRSL